MLNPNVFEKIAWVILRRLRMLFTSTLCGKADLVAFCPAPRKWSTSSSPFISSWNRSVMVYLLYVLNISSARFGSALRSALVRILVMYESVFAEAPVIDGRTRRDRFILRAKSDTLYV